MMRFELVCDPRAARIPDDAWALLNTGEKKQAEFSGTDSIFGAGMRIGVEQN